MDHPIQQTKSTAEQKIATIEHENAGALIGSIAGAAAGGLAGAAATDDDKKGVGIAIGAAALAAIGGLLGAMLDRD